MTVFAIAPAAAGKLGKDRFVDRNPGDDLLLDKHKVLPLFFQQYLTAVGKSVHLLCLFQVRRTVFRNQCKDLIPALFGNVIQVLIVFGGVEILRQFLFLPGDVLLHAVDITPCDILGRIGKISAEGFTADGFGIALRSFERRLGPQLFEMLSHLFDLMDRFGNPLIEFGEHLRLLPQGIAVLHGPLSGQADQFRLFADLRKTQLPVFRNTGFMKRLFS